jgi:redox-sensitive bicupin YhaK (pirin superfamily)
VQVARGAVAVNEVDLKQGDGAAISDELTIEVTGREPSEVLLFDMA